MVTDQIDCFGFTTCTHSARFHGLVMVLKSSISFLFVQKKKREEAEKLRKLEEERLRKAMAADAARKEAERLHRVGHDARIA